MPIERPRPFQTQVPLSNQFQVLGNIPKPSQVAQTQTSKQASSFYIAKTHIMKIQILKSQHFNRFGLLDLSKIFSKGKYFIQNDPLKTRRFYEFILVDTDSIEVSHIQNQNTTNICYSKLFMNLSVDSLLLPIKHFLKTVNQLHMIIMIIWMHGFLSFYSVPLIIPGSSIGLIKFKFFFQIGSKNGGCILAPFQQFYILKSNPLLITSKNRLRV